jgi:hypothetical protein
MSTISHSKSYAKFYENGETVVPVQTAGDVGEILVSGEGLESCSLTSNSTRMPPYGTCQKSYRELDRLQDIIKTCDTSSNF